MELLLAIAAICGPDHFMFQSDYRHCQQHYLRCYEEKMPKGKVFLYKAQPDGEDVAALVQCIKEHPP